MPFWEKILYFWRPEVTTAPSGRARPHCSAWPPGWHAFRRARTWRAQQPGLAEPKQHNTDMVPFFIAGCQDEFARILWSYSNYSCLSWFWPILFFWEALKRLEKSGRMKLLDEIRRHRKCRGVIIWFENVWAILYPMVQLQLVGKHFPIQHGAEECTELRKIVQFAYRRNIVQIHRFNPTSAQHGLNLAPTLTKIIQFVPLEPAWLNLGPSLGPTWCNLAPSSWTCLEETPAQVEAHMVSKWKTLLVFFKNRVFIDWCFPIFFPNA